MDPAGYDHTQRGKLHWWLHFAAITNAVIFLFFIPKDPLGIVYITTVFVTGMLEFFAWTVITLRVYDDGDAISLRFGPIPLAKKRIAYQETKSAEPSRSKVIDGWGVHYIPGRGWTYNLWGFECVELTTIDNRTIRIGTDDSSGLNAFLQTKITHLPGKRYNHE